MINRGNIPIVLYVTVEMQSDAVEQQNASDESPFISMPGEGKGREPCDLGDPKRCDEEPPHCLTMGCSVICTPFYPGDPGAGGGDEGLTGGLAGGACEGSNCPDCSG